MEEADGTPGNGQSDGVPPGTAGPPGVPAAPPPPGPGGGAPTASGAAPERPRLRATLWRLTKDTFSTCMHHRVTGLAAEAAFFTLLSLPPLLLGLVGLLSYLGEVIGTGTITSIRDTIIAASGKLLSSEGVHQLVVPLLNSVFAAKRPDVVSLGFLIALWSGSRAVNVFVDTITIMYGLDGRRGIVRTRLLAFGLYVVALLLGTVALPLIVAGPELVRHAVPELATAVDITYWPVVVLLSVVFLTTLYHLSVPVRTPWREDLPGAFVALALWIIGSALLRVYLSTAVEGPTVYGSLAAPIAVLLWLGLTALAVLIGAAMNAAVDRQWPNRAITEARMATALEHEAEARSELARSRALRDGPGAGPAVPWAGRGSTALPQPAGDGGPEPPAEFPERWADVLPPEDVGGRLRIWARHLWRRALAYRRRFRRRHPRVAALVRGGRGTGRRRR